MPDAFKDLDNQQKLKKKVEYLENRLSHNNIKLNENLAKNKQLRNKIDQIRKERVVYDKIYRDLEYDFMQAKDEFAKSYQEQFMANHSKE